MVDHHNSTLVRAGFRIAIAFLSGAISLVSQLLALRIAQQELSASEITTATVLVAALGGLSLGSLLLARLAELLRRYCFAELVLLLASGLVAIVAVSGRGLARWLAEMDCGLFTEALIFSLMLVVPINFLVGAVVPVLAGTESSRRDDTLVVAFAWVYAIETIGAASGALLLTFVAIPKYGLSDSVFVLGVVAAVVCVGSIALHLILKSLDRTASRAKEETNEKNAPAGSGKLESTPSRLNEPSQARSWRWYLLLAALVGSSASLGMELVWQRYFAIVFGSDTHSYAIVAAVFLLGISAGSLIASVIFRFRQATVELYGWLLGLVGTSIVASIWILSVGLEVESFQESLKWLDSSPMIARLALAGAVMFVPSLLQGIALPVLVRVWVSSDQESTAKSGEIYGVVILGNIVGVMLCALVLIPTLGLKGTGVVLAVLCLFGAAGLHLLLLKRLHDAAKRKFDSVCFGVMLVAGSGVAVSLFVSPQYPGLNLRDTWVLDYYNERSSHTVAVIRSSSDASRKRLLMDGVTIGEAGGGVDEKQQMLAHLPFMVAGPPRANVLTIGLGTGLLAAELGEIPQVESVVCYELSKSVIEASQLFVDVDRSKSFASKLDIRHGDGIRFLRGTPEKFDVIVSDGKSRPGASANLQFFTEEYYRLCAAKLAPQGVFVQWVSLRCDRCELETIIATFANSFADGRIAVAADSIYLVGLSNPLELDPNAIQDHLGLACAESLRAYGWSEADDVLSMGWLNDNVIAVSDKEAPVNTLNHPILETFAWSSFRHSISALSPQYELIAELVDAAIEAESRENGQSPGRLQACRHLIEVESIVTDAKDGWLDAATGKFNSALAILPQLKRHKSITVPFRKLARAARASQDASQEYSALINLSEINATTPDDELRISEILASQGRSDLALQHAYNAAKKSDGQPRFTFELGRLCLRSQKYGQALRRFDKVISGSQLSHRAGKPDWSRQARLLKGVTLQKLNRTAEGESLVQQALKEEPALLELYNQHQFD